MQAQAARKVPQIRFKGLEGGWQELQFRDIISNLSGGAAIKPEDYQDNGVRTVPKGAVNSSGIADLSGSKYISPNFFVQNKSSAVSAGNLITSLRDLVPSAPNLGRIVKIGGQAEVFLMPQGVYKIELYAGIDEAFVISYSNGNKFRKIIASEKNGSTQVHLRNGEFLDISIGTPSHSEQTQVGEYFRELDSLIALHQRKHDKLVALKKAILQKMFPQPGATTPEIRFKGFSGDWVEKPFDQIATRATQAAAEASLPRLEYEDIISGKGELNKNLTKKVSAKKGIKFEIGAVLFGKLRPYLRNWFLAEFEGIAIGDFWVLKATSGVPSFLYCLIQIASFETIANQSAGSKMPRSDWKLVSSSAFPVPPTESEEQKIGSYFRTLDELISKHATQLQKLQQIKSACLEKMFV